MKTFKIIFNVYKFGVVNDTLEKFIRGKNREQALYQFMFANKEYYINLLSMDEWLDE